MLQVAVGFKPWQHCLKDISGANTVNTGDEHDRDKSSGGQITGAKKQARRRQQPSWPVETDLPAGSLPLDRKHACSSLDPAPLSMEASALVALQLQLQEQALPQQGAHGQPNQALKRQHLLNQQVPQAGSSAHNFYSFTAATKNASGPCAADQQQQQKRQLEPCSQLHGSHVQPGLRVIAAAAEVVEEAAGAQCFLNM